jgi:glutathione S-transferase
MAEDLRQLAPARLVPVLRTPEGDVVGETSAMAETLAERHPAAGLWPRNEAHRMRARWMCAEMAAGFSALRSACPMQLQHVNSGFVASEAVRADLDRITSMWAAAFEMSGTGGWLFGAYSLADAFYAPVAARIVGYDLEVPDQAAAYCRRVISDPAFRAWRAEGLKQRYDPFPYPMGLPTRPWPD